MQNSYFSYKKLLITLYIVGKKKSLKKYKKMLAFI